MTDLSSDPTTKAALGPPSFSRPSFWRSGSSDELIRIARQAGAVIMDIRARSALNTRAKGDGSPVTAADQASEALILDGLNAWQEAAIISEEKENNPDLKSQSYCWLVDPLDGTRNFVQDGDQFSVNIGLLIGGIPYLGVVYAPATDDLFYGEPGLVYRVKNGQRMDLAPRPVVDHAPPDILTSLREAKRLPVPDWQKQGRIGGWQICSSAYKFGLLAAGEAHIYMRTGTTYEWDTAAGDALLRAMGGAVIAPDGQALLYGKRDYRNHNFVAYAAPNASPYVPGIMDLISDY